MFCIDINLLRDFRYVILTRYVLRTRYVHFVNEIYIISSLSESENISILRSKNIELSITQHIDKNYVTIFTIILKDLLHSLQCICICIYTVFLLLICSVKRKTLQNLHNNGRKNLVLSKFLTFSTEFSTISKLKEELKKDHKQSA